MKKLVYCLAASSLLFIGCQKETEINPLSEEKQTTVNEIPAEVAKIFEKQTVLILKNDTHSPSCIGCAYCSTSLESGPYSQSMSNLAECIVQDDEENTEETQLSSHDAFTTIYSTELIVNKRYYGGLIGDDCFIIMQTDGNLVLYSRNASGALTARWSTHTWGNAGARCFMQNDGNLVVYSKTWKPLWCSQTWNPNKELSLYVTDQGVSIRDNATVETFEIFGKLIQMSNTIDERTIYWKKHYR